MLIDVLGDPALGLQFVRKKRSVTSMADALTRGDRSRLRQWAGGKISIGATNRHSVGAFLADAIHEDFGAPVLWWGVEEEQYLHEIRARTKKVASSKEEERREGQLWFYRAYTESGIKFGVYRFCAHDAPETPGATFQDTLRRVMLNVTGMHVARNFAKCYPLSKSPSAREAAFLALRRARTAAALRRHAVEKQGEALTEERKAQLQVIAIDIRLNQVAIPARFREFFPDGDVAKEVAASSDVDLLGALAKYKKDHPDRIIIAANALVFASLQRRLPDAVKGWELMRDENEMAADLAYHLPSHERPLAESPDVQWLIAQNGGSTVLRSDSQSPLYEYQSPLQQKQSPSQGMDVVPPI